jgi:hypothetical protein
MAGYDASIEAQGKGQVGYISLTKAFVAELPACI